MPEPLDVHKALADDTRHRLYRYLRLSGRPVGVREMAVRLSLHPNTLRPHLRRLEEAGLVASETSRGATVGRPQSLYTAVDREEREGRDYRLLADILSGLLTGRAEPGPRAGPGARVGRVPGRADLPPPGARRPAGPNLADPPGGPRGGRLRPPLPAPERQDRRDQHARLPFRELLDEHRELVCAVHQGLLEGILGASRPPLTLAAFQPLAERGTCRLTAKG